MKHVSILVSILLVMFLVSCGGGESTDNEEKTKTEDNAANVSEANESAEIVMSNTDFTEQSIPITMDVPEGAEITEGMLNGEFGGVNLLNYEVAKDGWILDISMMDEEPYREKEDYIQDAKDFALETEGFAEIVDEDESGFIYKLENEEGNEYNLYYVIIKDDRAIEIEEGLKFTNYTLEEITSMFEAAKTAK
ncbi:MAG: hypothetical protein U9N51_08125 [Bacteroidota bacterium]|nr:hypothetical protein [Bacteroidota bacterium]